LNCDQREPDASPCGACESCENPSRYLVEWDTAGRGGDLATVTGLLQQHIRVVELGKYRFFFFDECHGLTAQAQDALLKKIEEAPPGIVFCFATTEPSRMKSALLSRLHEVRIYPIAPKDAFEYLEWIARKKLLAFDSDAIHLMIAAKPPHIRDLIIGLQELAESGQRITVDLVKEELGLQVCDHLSAYMAGLANGKRSSQIQAIQSWPDDPVEKRIWIERFIASTYYNDVLGFEYIVDPLVHSLASVRRDFVQSLQERLGLDRAEMQSAFEAMMKFWSRQTTQSVSGVNIALSLFESLLNDGLAKMSLINLNGQEVIKPIPAQTIARSDEPDPVHLSSYLSLYEVREVINRASFFVQDTGKHLNAFASLRLRGGSNLEASADDAFAQLMDMLDCNFGDRSEPFAAIGVLEREHCAIVGRVLAFVSLDWRDEMVNSCETWRASNQAVIDVAFGLKANGEEFQWSAVRDICAGCDEVTADGQDLRRMLEIKRGSWRTAGPFSGKRVHFSRRLSKAFIGTSNFPAVEPLSAFDAGATKWICSGWERKEALDRKKEIVRRRLELDAVAFRWRDDPIRSESEKAAMLASWNRIAAEQRVRRWRGWWCA
jgi:hypothetical protein